MAWKTTTNLGLKVADNKGQAEEQFDIRYLLNDNWLAIDAIDMSNRLDAVETRVNTLGTDLETQKSNQTIAKNRLNSALTNAETALSSANTAQKQNTSINDGIKTMIGLDYDMIVTGSYTGRGAQNYNYVISPSAPSGTQYIGRMLILHCDDGYPLIAVKPATGASSTVLTPSGEEIYVSWLNTTVSLRMSRGGSSTAYDAEGKTYNYVLICSMPYCYTVTQYLD